MNKRRLVMAIATLTFAIALIAVSSTAANIVVDSKRLSLDDAAGVWEVEEGSRVMRVRLDADGRFLAQDWLGDLGCSDAAWPDELASIHWNHRVRVEGRWDIDENDRMAVRLWAEHPERCLIATMSASYEVGDAALHIYLRPIFESAAELVLRRQ